MFPASSKRGNLRAAAVSLCVLAPFVVAPAAGAAVAQLSNSHKLVPPTCNTASPAVIKRLLNITVAGPRRSAAGRSFLCEYGSSASSLAVVIQYSLASGSADYQQVRNGYDSHSEPTTPLRTLGKLANEAFTASLGTGSLAQHSVVALQGKLQVVLASSASIPRLVTLMRQILTVS